MNGHRSDAKKQDKLAVDAHFLQPGHDFERDAKFTIIEKITNKEITGPNLTEDPRAEGGLLDEQTRNHCTTGIQHWIELPPMNAR